MLAGINFILFFVYMALFYKIVYRRTLHIPKVRHLLLLAGMFALTLVGDVLIHSGFLTDKALADGNFFISTLTLCLSPLTGIILSNIKPVEIFKYWIVQFIFSLMVEMIFRDGLELLFPGLQQSKNMGTVLITCLEIILLLCLSKLSVFQLSAPLILSGKTAAVLSASFGIISIFLNFIKFSVQELSESALWSKYGFFLSLATLSLCMTAIIFLYVFLQREYFEKQAALENEYSKQQREYFHILLEKETETKKFRHDMTNHMLCLYNMAVEKDMEGIQTYLTDILHVFLQINQKEYNVGNETLNVLLNYYLAPVREDCRIEVDGAFGETLHIPHMEICTIFSNILKNAVEAVCKIPPETCAEKLIRIHASHGKKFMKLTVQNTYAGEIEIRNNIIVTKKADKENHGFGMENMRAAVKCCGGTFTYQIEPLSTVFTNTNAEQHHRSVQIGLFSVEVILPVKHPKPK